MASLPETIGSYKVIRELGHGGFATVYLAESSELTQVALKVLKPYVRDHAQLERFKQEARIITELNHPNIIHIIGTGDAEEAPFIAMEYVRGGDLRDRLKTGPLARNEAMHIVRCIGSALSYVHTYRSQIIHRDITPGNILFDTTQDPVRPVLTDFGLIKFLSADKMGTLTRTGSIIGTLRYIAPEQLEDQKSLTPTTDLYALSIVFFEMLAGRPPFEADSEIKLMEKHRTEPLPDLSSMAPDIGTFFDNILKRAAAKNPADRYPSIKDFVDDLETANYQAEQSQQKRAKQQKRAITQVELTQGYIEKEHYLPGRALEMVGAALEFDPGNVEALRLKGRVHLEQKQFEDALEAYRQAYEQVRKPLSEAGYDYLLILSKLADQCWQSKELSEAIKYYHDLMRILGEGNYIHTPLQEIDKAARSRLIDYYYGEGNKAYQSSNFSQDSGNLDEAIAVLAKARQWLDQLKDQSKIEELGHKWKQLQIRKHTHRIDLASQAIAAIDAEKGSLHFDEQIFEYYEGIDACYRELIKLEENYEWKEGRRKKLREQSKHRDAFARHLTEQDRPDYIKAIAQYQIIQDIESDTGLTEELNINPAQRIAELKEAENLHHKYHHIRQLMGEGRFQEALAQLETDFINQHNYEYRDVAQMLWELVYAKQHAGQYPLGWDGASGLEVWRDGLIEAERARVGLLRVALRPWVNFAEMRAEQHRQLEAIETQLKQTQTTFDLCDLHHHNVELTQLKEEIAPWQFQLQQADANITQPSVEACLKQLDTIEANLKEYYRPDEIQKLLNQSEVIETIEKDPLFAALRTLTPLSLDIKRATSKIQAQHIELLNRAIDQLKVEMDETQRRQIELEVKLNEAQGNRTELETKMGEARHNLTELRAELEITQRNLTELRAELGVTQHNLTGSEQELKRTLTETAPTRNELARLKRQHKINQYTVPIALALAMMAGAFIAPQFQTLPGATAITMIALTLLVAYLFYHIWVYYFPQSPNE